MDLLEFTTRMQRSAKIIRCTVENTSYDEARWRPEPKRWSILDVMCHLLDEEREDFRPRIDCLLHQPNLEWTPIDPEGWVTSRDYASRDLDETLSLFLSERQKSCSWLLTLSNPDWNVSRPHPAGFTIRAGDLLHSWLAHDYLHIRQIVKLRYDLAASKLQPYSSLYAGEW